MFGKLFSLILILPVVFCQQIVLKWENAKAYTEISNGTDHPYGFYYGLIPHPPDDPIRNNIVHVFSNLIGKYIKIWAETIDAGAAICLKDNDSGPTICSQGNIVECYAPSKDELKFEFYCGESCQSSDVYFWYKFKVSDIGANDQWCADQVDEYPSDDRPLPSIIPRKRATPSARPQPGGSGSTIVPTVLVTISALIVAMFM